MGALSAAIGARFAAIGALFASIGELIALNGDHIAQMGAQFIIALGKAAVKPLHCFFVYL